MRWKIYSGIVLVMILLNVVAWNSTAFCDWYISHLFPLWVNTYGRVTGLVPFSVGEIMIVLGVALLVSAVLLALFAGIFCLIVHIHKRRAVHVGEQSENAPENHAPENRVLKKHVLENRVPENFVSEKMWRKFRGFCGGFYQAFAWILLAVGMIMTLNCFILYHGSTFSEKYFGVDTKEYTMEDLVELRNFIVEQCNLLCEQIPRNADGSITYPGDMAETAGEAMVHLGETYGGLDGFYPAPKPLRSSDFMSQQYMAGYYFPFSMEANYNDVMYEMNKPSTFCHELAHLKGYIYEDEANFIGYLACIQSEDIYFRYSGYLSVLYYVDNDFYDAVGGDIERYRSQPLIDRQVHEDNVFLTQEEWDRIEGKALLDTEVVDAVSDSLTDASLKLNGVSDGMISYSRVVKLLLQYHNLYGYETE